MNSLEIWIKQFHITIKFLKMMKTMPTPLIEWISFIKIILKVWDM